MATAAATLRLTGGEALVRLLQAEGVREAFGIVGGKLAPLLHALSRSPVGFVGVRHEAHAAIMAAAVHAASGRIALAFGEMGPGGLNLAAGAGVAFNNNLAVLLVTTNQHRAASYPHRGMFMDMDTHALFAPLTKWRAVVHDVRRLPELVRSALREALAGRPGPVHLDIPHDVLAAEHDWSAAEFDVPPERYRALHAPRPAAAALAQAADTIAAARRPLLVAGGGVVRADAVDAVRSLAAHLRAPVVPTQMALGTVTSDSPHFIGHGGLVAGDAVRQAFDGADVVVAVGCRFSSWLWDERGPFVRREHRLVNINLDASALGNPALHEVALLADARAALDDLMLALAGRQPASEADWLPQLREHRTAYDARLRAMAADGESPMHPAALAAAIGLALPHDALVVFDGGHTSFWSNDLTPVRAPRSCFHDPGMSQLGFGLPFALALQRLHPQRPVFNLTGDGSFGFTLQELDTARREALPVVTIVHNNEAWGVIRAGQRAALDIEVGTSLAGTDHAAIARGFGCIGERVERVAELPAALARALQSRRPAVLDCRTRFVPHPCMPAFGSMNRFGHADA
ncbi:MAG: thiamine pyrophosphate-binding protein [Ideonella sp.]|nr:thiamine pyrophosphate-binding protein [Ideonella sp.]MCC7455597.1 thiamine pyrophosphate-binding protein [Nitrospira sp.]